MMKIAGVQNNLIHKFENLLSYYMHGQILISVTLSQVCFNFIRLLKFETTLDKNPKKAQL